MKSTDCPYFKPAKPIRTAKIVKTDSLCEYKFATRTTILCVHGSVDYQVCRYALEQRKILGKRTEFLDPL